ncbi:SwmB domain-containing protein [Verminephrobacter aporrectodeae]|nr:SwmB domain-containing protein [Verminephrobacter aporrectodeae]
MASDTKAPKLIITGANTPTAAGDQLVLTYDGPNDLDRNIDAAGFTVTSTTGTAITVSRASVDAKAQTITLTLSRAITTQDVIKISYTPPANGNGVQDVAGNDAQEFADQDVINNTAGPVFVKDYPGIEGNKLTLAYTGGGLEQPQHSEQHSLCGVRQ